MIRKLAAVAMGILVIGCSEDITEEPLNLKGEIKGKVMLYNEFGHAETDLSGSTILLEGSADNATVSSDSEGRYTLSGISPGTYNLVVSKPGFSPYTRRGVSIVGGAEPIYSQLYLTRPSTTMLDNISSSVSDYMLTLNGTLIHNHPNTTYPFLRLALFVGHDEDVSPENYAQAGDQYFFLINGNDITWNIYLNPAKFSSGETVFIKVFGLSMNGMRSTNEAGKYEYSGLSNTPSNIFSIQLP